MPDQTKSRYLDYLPAIYAGPDNAYLGKFLLPFEQVLTDFEDLLAVIDRYFAPALTAPDFLPWLAQWVALVLDENWDEPKRRQLIADALELHRLRGTVAGIRRYLQIYDEQYAVQFRESRVPGGMQIGVSSRIGGMSPYKPPMSQIKLMERQIPLTYYDYYLVTTEASPGRPGHPAEAVRGQPLQLYYRADRVKRVTVGVEAEKQFVELELLDGEAHRHVPAEVSRLDGRIDDRYRLTLDHSAVTYQGDTFIIEETERPYEFTVDVQVPTGWQFLFDFPISFADDRLLEKAFREAFRDHGIILPDSIDIVMSKPGCQWQVKYGDREYTIRRKPLYPSIFQVTRDKDKEPLFEVSLGFASFDKQIIERRIKSEFKSHRFPLSPNADFVSEGGALRWWVVSDQERQYVIARQGMMLRAYRWVGQGEWTKAMQPNNVHAIRAIIDEVKPAHTLYYLKLTPKSDLGALLPMQIGVRSTVDTDSTIG
jgi:phage tail-like protein